MASGLERQFNEIKRANVDPGQLAAFSSEDEFNRIGVEILIETGSYVCVAASCLPADTKSWDRNQAIVGGQAVRLFKLISALLDQTCQRRRETTFVFGRLAFEAIVNLRYLVLNASEELFDSYVRYSLRHEKKLYDRIQRNVALRGGTELPIEKRMIRSILATTKEAGVSLDSISPTHPKNWGDKNCFERAEAVGLAEPYLAMFGGGSHSIHGNWMDLLEYHLDSSDGRFTPELEWSRPRPQVSFAIALLTIEALRDYFRFVGGDDAVAVVEPALLDLWTRNKTASEAHENYLVRRMEVGHAE